MAIPEKVLDQLNLLSEIGVFHSRDTDISVLLEKFLFKLKKITHSDGGTIYIITPEKNLRFVVAVSDSLHFYVGGSSNTPIPFPELPLFLEDGKSNDTLMVAYAVNHKKSINIKDAYTEEGFDFSGTRRFDETTGYRTKAVLTIPIKNHEEEVISVLQLINPIDPKTGKVMTFSQEDKILAESFASIAGIAYTNQLLLHELRGLFTSLIRVIAEAIDTKSPTTSNHGKRVPVITSLLAKAVNETEEGPFKDTTFSKNQLYELEIAALLHDCGKITTPEYLIDKHTKLETIFNRMELISTRIDVLNSHAYCKTLEKKLEWVKKNAPEVFKEGEALFAEYETHYASQFQMNQENLEFIARCNQSQEKITEESVDRLQKLRKFSWKEGAFLLTDDEFENLIVKEGNLTEKEKDIIKNHVVMTHRMLSQLKYPKELRLVPEIAASHHERFDGKGYPRGLKGPEMLVQSRILIIADIFEALSAPDRAYKKVLPLSLILKMMKEMAENGHLDPDLFEVFVKKKVYMEYAVKYLMPEQIDID